MTKIDVLDHGYVRLVDQMGSDLSVVNAARVSYDKEVTEFSERDIRLLKFLWQNEHTSPFRHAAVCFEIYAPLFVARQWWKYAVSSTHVDDQNGWNESSRRYVTENEEFYIPGPRSWRSAPTNSKQGSGPPLDPEIGLEFTQDLREQVHIGAHLYRTAMEAGIAPEQARLFLPAYALYVRWRWTVSLQGVLHFIQQRIDHGAQYEIQEYAAAVARLTSLAFPQTYNMTLGETT